MTHFDNRIRSSTPMLALVLVIACSDTLPGTAGDLGEGSFTYECVSDADTACSSDPFEELDVPGAIAAGARFDLRFHEWEGQPLRIVPGSESFVAVSDPGFLALRPGTVAMLAESKAEERIVDLTHIVLVTPEAIGLSGQGTRGDQPMTIDDYWEWSCHPQTTDGSEIAGSLACEWTSSDPSVVYLTQQGSHPINGLRAVGVGTATVTVSADSLTTSVEVKVE